MNPIVIIPALNPEPRLVTLVRDLRADFGEILVVDDGSATGREIFDQLETEGLARILRHAANRGKGAALKTAFADVLARRPDAPGVVTVDADGQHLPHDIRAVARTLVENPTRVVLGVRTFGREIPLRSLWGNLWTRGEFFLLTGCAVRDTQTGLRAIPNARLPELLAIPGERYDFEIAALVRAARATEKPIQVPISAVYEPGNRTSHFRPLADTLNTQLALLRAAITRK